jgi:DNA-binding MarR family transcriptional regulator
LLDIGDRNRAREEGFGWITQERDKFDLRRHAASVTPVGRALLNKAKNAMMGFAHRNGSQSSSFVDLLAPERPEQ